MNVFTRIGNWVEKHFPEKMTNEDVANLVNIRFKCHLDAFEVVDKQIKQLSLDSMAGWKQHEDRLSKIEADLNIFKTQATVKSRIVGTTPDTMTPFASRLKPVQPANGSDFQGNPYPNISGGNQ